MTIKWNLFNFREHTSLIKHLIILFIESSQLSPWAVGVIAIAHLWAQSVDNSSVRDGLQDDWPILVTNTFWISSGDIKSTLKEQRKMNYQKRLRLFCLSLTKVSASVSVLSARIFHLVVLVIVIVYLPSLLISFDTSNKIND